MKTATKKRGIEKSYNLNVFMSSKFRVDNAVGVFTADSKGDALKVKKSGNGAVIPFLKRYTGKKVVVFVVNK